MAKSIPHFKTSDPAAITALRKWRTSIANHCKTALVLPVEVGASQKRCCRYNDGHSVTFIFERGRESLHISARFGILPEHMFRALLQRRKNCSGTKSGSCRIS